MWEVSWRGYRNIEDPSYELRGNADIGWRLVHIVDDAVDRTHTVDSGHGLYYALDDAEDIIDARRALTA